MKWMNRRRKPPVFLFGVGVLVLESALSSYAAPASLQAKLEAGGVWIRYAEGLAYTPGYPTPLASRVDAPLGLLRGAVQVQTARAWGRIGAEYGATTAANERWRWPANLQQNRFSLEVLALEGALGLQWRMARFASEHHRPTQKNRLSSFAGAEAPRLRLGLWLGWTREEQRRWDFLLNGARVRAAHEPVHERVEAAWLGGVVALQWSRWQVQALVARSLRARAQNSIVGRFDAQGAGTLARVRLARRWEGGFFVAAEWSRRALPGARNARGIWPPNRLARWGIVLGYTRSSAR